MNPEKLTTITRFSTGTENPHVEDLSREFRGKSNSAFFAEVRKRLDSTGREDPRFAHGGKAAIGLIGEYGLTGMAIRNAQRHLRLDKQPSYWSHAFIFFDEISADAAVNRSSRRSPWIWESTLESPDPFSQYGDLNAVSPRRLSDYDYSRFDLLRAHCVPNVAVIVFGLKEDEDKKILSRANNPDVDRLRYDLLGLLGTWYAFITDQAHKPNPLAAGEAIYSSAYVQLAYEAAEIDLALGAHQRNTSPEHLWQTAKWFYQPYVDRGHPVRVFSCVRDPYGGLLPPEITIPTNLESLMAMVR